jgi:branched-chain amino acid transport system ATP-binding protein
LHSDPPICGDHSDLILDIDGLSIFYDGLQAVWDISFAVEAGSVTALIGSNGAGKSTILQAITGILSQVKGNICFKGKSITHLSPHRRVDLGISLIPEGRRIFPYLTVQENLEIGAYSRQARRQIVHTMGQVLELFPLLADRQKQIAVSLSGGEQQMLAIGRGLMSLPRLLMLDEPSLGLAPLMVNLVFETIEKINREGVTVLVVEQNVHRTLQIARQAYVLENGKITLNGPGADLLGNPHIKKAYLGL